MSSFLARPSLTRARSMSIGCQSRRELLWPCRPSLSSRKQASARPIFSQSLVMVSLPSSVNCSKKPSPGIILAWRLTLGPAMHGQRRVWHTYRLVAGSEWGCPALPPSFFGKKFWRVSWLFLKFSKFLDSTSPSTIMSASIPQPNVVVGLASSIPAGPARCARGKPKSFSTRLRTGSVCVRPSEKSAKVRSIPLVVAAVCLRASAICCTVN